MKKSIQITETELINMVQKMLKNINEQDYSTDIERGTQPREKEVKSIFGSKYGAYIPNDVIRYIRKNPKQIFARLYDIYGDTAFDYLNMAKEGGEITESEEHMKNDRYMFFSNLEQMERQCGLLLNLNHDEIQSILDNGHDWAQDHIAEAKNNLDQVFDFLMNESKNYHTMNDEVVMEGSEITEKKKKNVPTNPKLWKQSLDWAKSRYKVCPSAYCNGAAVKHYNSKGGKWKKK